VFSIEGHHLTITDPTDPILSEILQDHIAANKLPDQYCKKSVLETMRKCGLLTHRTAEGFILAAKCVANEKSIKHGISLLENLVKLHREANFQWGYKHYAIISDIGFVPACDLRQLLLPPSKLVELPHSKTLQRTDPKVQRKLQKLGRKRNGGKNLSEMCDEESQSALDFDDDMEENFTSNVVITEMFELANNMIASGNYTNMKEAKEEAKTNFISLKVFSTDSQKCHRFEICIIG
jgi:hypothetical protein